MTGARMSLADREAGVGSISVRVPDAVRLTGLSRTRVYELMKSGDIEFVKVGETTVIPYDSLKAFIDRLRTRGCRSDL